MTGDRLTLLRSIGLLALWLSGCAALHPMQGIPIEQYGGWLPCPSRSLEATIDLSLLRQQPPPEHIVDSRDLLGIYIEGILGAPDQALPTFQALPDGRPTVGYPIEVRQDGTISLPYTAPIPVRGLTIPQVESRIRHAYSVETPLLRPGEDRILVSLVQPRTYRVLVVRQEGGQRRYVENPYESTNLQFDKRGTGHVLHLPAFQNDVLHALAETGGFPGLDAQNTIYVIRCQDRSSMLGSRPETAWSQTASGAGISQSPDLPSGMPPPSLPAPAWPASSFPPGFGPAAWQYPVAPPPDMQGGGFTFRGQSPTSPFGSYRSTGSQLVAGGHSIHGGAGSPSSSGSLRAHTATPMPLPHFHEHEIPAEVRAYAQPGAEIIRIPLRIIPGAPLSFSPADVILGDGDIVYIEARDDEFFYSAGLLGGGRYRLPRDRDLDLVEAISLIEGEGRAARPGRSIGGSSVLNQDVTIGASRVIIHRKQPDETWVALKVNLYDALRNPNQPVLIQPEDRLYLRYAPWEVPFAFLERHLLEGVVIGAASSMTFGN